jgi:hypothetical protein
MFARWFLLVVVVFHNVMQLKSALVAGFVHVSPYWEWMCLLGG